MVHSVPYTRGMYYTQPAWSKDTSPKYFDTLAMRIGWPLVKIALLLNLYLALSKTLHLDHWVCILTCLVVILYYQDATAWFYGLKRIPSMD